MSTVPAQLAHARQTTSAWRALAGAAILAILLAVVLTQELARGHRPPASSASPAHAVRSADLSHEGLLSLPSRAQGPVSAALGADARAYRISSAAGALAARNPAQRLRARFDAAGVALSSGATRLGLSLRAVGYGHSLRTLGEVAPRRA